MKKILLFTILLAGSIALVGCHVDERASVRADYYDYGAYPYRIAPYDLYYYDPYWYPPIYAYYPYPYLFFGGAFIYDYPYYYYPYHGHYYPRPGDRSLRGFRGGVAPAPGRSGGGGSSRGRSLR